MSILDVEKMWSQTTSQGATKDGQTFRMEFQEGWQITHSVNATELEILNAPGLPQINDLYPGTFVPCRGVISTSKLGPVFTIVIVRYEGEVGPGGPSDSPISKLPEYDWSDTTSSEPIDQDWDGNPIVTANNEPINGVTMDLADQTLTVTRNYALFSPWLTHQYRHSVNSDYFAGYPPGTARLVGFSAKSQVADGFLFWKVNARIQFRYPFNTTPDKAWYARVRHEGYYENIDGDIVRAADDWGADAVKPVLLDEDGVRLPAGADPHWLEVKLYGELPYQALGLL